MLAAQGPAREILPQEILPLNLPPGAGAPGYFPGMGKDLERGAACNGISSRRDVTGTLGRVLLVEDDAGVREGIRRALSQAGLDVTEAGSCDAALDLLEAASSFAILVTDICMPGSQDGVALADVWRAKVPGHPVLFVSGYSDGRLDDGALAANDVVLSKPFQRSLLVSTVVRLLSDLSTGGP